MTRITGDGQELAIVVNLHCRSGVQSSQQAPVPDSGGSVVFEPLPEQILSLSSSLGHGIEDTDGKVEKSNITFIDTIGHGWFGWIVSGI